MDFGSIFGLAGTAFNLAESGLALDNEVAAFHEKQRREQKQFDQLAGEVQARGGSASGLSSSSASLTNYMAGLTSEFQKRKEWSEADFQAAHDAKSMSLFFDAASSIGSMVMGGMGNFGGMGGFSGGKSASGLGDGAGGPGGSYYSSLLGGFKLED